MYTGFVHKRTIIFLGLLVGCASPTTIEPTQGSTGKSDVFNEAAAIFPIGAAGYYMGNVEIGGVVGASCAIERGISVVDLQVEPTDGFQLNHVHEDGFFHYRTAVDSCDQMAEARAQFEEMSGSRQTVGMSHSAFLARSASRVDDDGEPSCAFFIAEEAFTGTDDAFFVSRGDIFSTTFTEDYCLGAEEALELGEPVNFRLLSELPKRVRVSLDEIDEQFAQVQGQIEAPEEVREMGTGELGFRDPDPEARPSVLLTSQTTTIRCSADGRALELNLGAQTSTYARHGSAADAGSWRSELSLEEDCDDERNALEELLNGLGADSAAAQSSITWLDAVDGEGDWRQCYSWMVEEHTFTFAGRDFVSLGYYRDPRGQFRGECDVP